MASSNTTTANLLSVQGGVVTMSIQRKEAARRAASEIEEFCAAIQRVANAG